MNEANLNGNLIREYDKSQLGDEPDALFAVDILAAAENNNPVYGVEGAWGYGYEKKDSNSFGDANFERIYEWDDKNQLIKTKDGLYTTYYVYNNEGDRVAKYTERSETLYFNKFWSWHIDPANAFAGGQLSKHIFLGDTRIVTKLSQETNNYIDAEKQRLYFYHSDHLGSASLITDYKGNEYERLEYTPYGELWVDLSEYTGSTYLPFKFSAKEMDSETGLYYYGARYLDSKYSLWKSTDPALGEYIPKAPINEQSRQYNQNLPGMGGIFNPINANLYHYAGNNPVRYVDPDGRENFIIQPGDTLSELVLFHNKTYGTNLTVSEVAKYNNITDPNMIYAGEYINMPIPIEKPYEDIKYVNAYYKLNSEDIQNSLPTNFSNVLKTSSDIVNNLGTFTTLIGSLPRIENLSWLFDTANYISNKAGYLGLGLNILCFLSEPNNENRDNIILSVICIGYPTVGLILTGGYEYDKFMNENGYYWNGFQYEYKKDDYWWFLYEY